MERQPFLLSYPSELLRLFVNGHIKSPDGNLWNISFCPGLKGTWTGVSSCFKFSKESFNFSFSWEYYGKSLRNFSNFSWDILKKGFELLCDIPSDMGESLTNTYNLLCDMPFGWPFRSLGQLFYGIIVKPCCKVVGFLSCTGLSALSLLMGTIVLPVGILLGGVTVGLGSLLVGVLTGITGTLFSGGVTLGAILNRFPKVKDNGSYGLYIVQNVL